MLPIEKEIAELKPGQAIHLGHSAVVINLAGVRIGLDLTTMDSWIPQAFANLTLGTKSRIEHLPPLHDTSMLVPRPEVLAKNLDILLYSHLHSDHFSLQFVAAAKKANPKLRIICPPNTRAYLTDAAAARRDGLAMRLLRWLGPRLGFQDRIAALNAYIAEVLNPSAERTELVGQIQEPEEDESILIRSGKTTLSISHFFVCHPSYQLYWQLPVESDRTPATVGYKVEFVEGGKKQKAILIGESGTDPAVLAEIFNERDGLIFVCFPVTEQHSSTGLKRAEELAAHTSLRTLALVERLVLPGTKILPVHQGLWYFRLTEAQASLGSEALAKLAASHRSALPFVDLAKVVRQIGLPRFPLGRMGDISATRKLRWKQYKMLARAAFGLPAAGHLVGILGEPFNLSREQKQPVSQEAAKEALSAYLTEYQMLHAEVDNAWNWQKALVNYCLLVIAGAITAVELIQDTQFLLLGASVLLSMLGLSFMEQTIRMTRIGRFYTTHLFPKINQAILEISNQDGKNALAAPPFRVMLWERYFRERNAGTVLMGMGAAGKFFICLISNLFCLVYFYVLSGGLQVSDVMLASFAVAAVVATFPLIIFVWNIRFVYGGRV